MNRNMMRQAQRMQAQLEKIQEELETATVEGSAGGGVVKVVMTGKQMVESVTIEPEAATGLLKRLYDAAIGRAGKVYNILRIQSLRPDVLSASTRLYVEVMHSNKSGLSRVQREMIATAVSRSNDCHY